MDFEYLNLKSINLQNCRGCYQCLGKGEWLCPIKDDRDVIEKMMMEADGTIFSTPVYVLNVSSARKFYCSINPNKPPKPSLFSTISFYFQRMAFARGDQDSTDYMYWKDKGWLDKGSKYYYNTKINPIKKTLAVVIAKIMFLFIPKPPKPKYI